MHAIVWINYVLSNKADVKISYLFKGLAFCPLAFCPIGLLSVGLLSVPQFSQAEHKSNEGFRHALQCRVVQTESEANIKRNKKWGWVDISYAAQQLTTRSILVRTTAASCSGNLEQLLYSTAPSSLINTHWVQHADGTWKGIVHYIILFNNSVGKPFIIAEIMFGLIGGGILSVSH